MKHLIVANWKMNPKTLVQAHRLFDSVAGGVKNIKNLSIAICPPFVYLSALSQSNIPTIKLGAQDCFWERQGAFTGEVSASQLKDLGCQYVILGHSERRKYLGETDVMVSKKLKSVLKERLKPIVCMSEVSQVTKIFAGIAKKDFKNIIVAFEPISAVGTGRPFSVKEAGKQRILLQNAGGDFKIIYGGSVNSNNAKDYIKKAGFSGLLVGEASLDSAEFVKIIRGVDKI